MLKTIVPKASRSLLSTRAPQFGPANLRTAPSFQIVSHAQQRSRGYASEASDYDVVFIGGGVAGYVGAIKAGQSGLKVKQIRNFRSEYIDTPHRRWRVLKNEAPWEAPA
jgi:hypothetical protein